MRRRRSGEGDYSSGVLYRTCRTGCVCGKNESARVSALVTDAKKEQEDEESEQGWEKETNDRQEESHVR